MTDPGTGPILYGFTLGLVGAVNPCGFPLLPAYLVVSGSGTSGSSLARRSGQAVTSGLAMTVGFVVVFGALGLLDAGASLALGWVAWVMIPVGAAMTGLGVAAAAGHSPRLPSPGRLFGRSRYRLVGLVGFGITYAVASLSCELPVFLAGVAGSFTRQGAGTGIPVSLAFAGGMGLVVTAVSVAGVGSRVVRLRRLRAWEPLVARIAGVIVAVIGAYLVLYWVSDLVSPLSTPLPVRVVERLQGDVSGWLSASPALTVALIGALVVAVLAAAALSAAHGAVLSWAHRHRRALAVGAPALAVGAAIAVTVTLLPLSSPPAARSTRAATSHECTLPGPATSSPEQSRSGPESHRAPEVAGRTATGEHFDLAAQRGHWVLVNFFASWCVNCRHELPQLVALCRSRPGGLRVVSVDGPGSTLVSAEDLVRSAGGHWPVITDAGAVTSFGVTGLPTSVLVNPAGRITARLPGPVDVHTVTTDVTGV